MTVGRSQGETWVLDRPQYTGEISDLLMRLGRRSDAEAIAFGIDCPIGLPRAYARQLNGYEGFSDFLRALNPAALFFDVARDISEVCLERPFYPAGNVSGAGHKLRLAQALNLAGVSGLSRQVDLKTENRPAGGQLFWTLGANQCGKAGLAAWRDLLKPALSRNQIKLWPFDGTFLELLADGHVVVAETYPAEALRQIGLRLSGSKRSQGSRRDLSSGILDVLEHLRVRPSVDLRNEISSGFGVKASGEDAFDSFIGVLGMINVLNGNRPAEGALTIDPWEGWVLGQTDVVLA